MLSVPIFAHRGASYDAPENTLASVRLGWEQKADAVEIDVYLTKDERIVTIHDVDTYRTAGVRQRIDEHSLEELGQIDVGSWKSSRFASETIPSLEEVIATLPDGKRLIIESKCGVQIVSPLQRVLEASAQPKSQFIHLSSSHLTLQSSKQFMPTLKTVWLQEFPADLPENERPASAVRPTLAEIIEQAHATEIDGLSFDLDWPVDATLIQAVKAAHLECHVWTVDDPQVAKRLIAAGVDSLTTNRPQWLREQLLTSTR